MIRRLSAPAVPAVPATPVLFPPAGVLIQISGAAGVARTTAAVIAVRRVQQEGEPAAWVQRRGGALYPPDLAQHGIDLDGLVVVHVPESAGPHVPARAAEMILRSGGYGLVVIDLIGAPVPPAGSVWQGRLLGLARRHDSRVIVLTGTPGGESSLGSLVGLRLEPRRRRRGGAEGAFALDDGWIKNKSSVAVRLAAGRLRAPWGFGERG